ncbi:hypothetical protein [Nocardia brasiliensis]|uniref:hypothetical protein n=1 Tax=Nocardia brasiliensis TaxID=37326 RepID=UPI00366ED869
MTDSYTIAISNTRTGVVAVTATVEIDATGVRLTEVRAEANGDTFVPEGLANIDFPLLVRTANMLSGPSVQPKLTPAPASMGENNTEPVDTDGDLLVPPEIDERVVVPVADLSKQPTGRAHERGQLQREQRSGVPADFGVTYWRLGSIAKVAKHYDVPHHVAQDWIKSLQQQGKLASPWRSKTSRPLRPK